VPDTIEKQNFGLYHWRGLIELRKMFAANRCKQVFKILVPSRTQRRVFLRNHFDWFKTIDENIEDASKLP